MNPSPETPPVFDEGIGPTDVTAPVPPSTLVDRSTFAAAAREPAAAPGPFRTLWQRFATRRFLFVSVLVHLCFGVAATVLVVQTITAKRKLTFVSAPPSPTRSTRATEHRVQMAQKQKTMSAPAQPHRVTTLAANAAVVLPQMPAMPALAGVITPAKMGGMGGAGFGLAAAGAPGNGGGGGGPVPFFGLRQSTGGGMLVGTFVDFKQDQSGHPNSMAIAGESMSKAEEKPNDIQKTEVGRFGNSNFNLDSLDRYYKGPNPLYTTQIFIPSMDAANGPREFGLGDKVQPRRWIIVYKATVRAPEAGRYRFVGMADDYIMVRFNHRLVLDGSFFNPTGHKPNKIYRVDGTGLDELEGDQFQVQDNEPYDLELLIGEHPGGQFMAYLMLEKEGVDYAKDSHGSPILPIFKLTKSEVPKGGGNAPVFANDTSWSIWKAER